VIEVWESEQDARAFLRERLRPAVEAVGAPTLPRPRFWPVHDYVA
jgi:hypothetical protein